jgi:hypothetical protein
MLYWICELHFLKWSQIRGSRMKMPNHAVWTSPEMQE